MNGRVKILLENKSPVLSVPVMMDLLDRIYVDAQEEESMEVFADAVDRAMCILAELQRQAFEVLQEVETEKRMYGERYIALPQKVC